MEMVSERLLRLIPDLIFLATVVLAQTAGTLWILRRFAATASRRVRLMIQIAAGLSLASLVLGFLMQFARFTRFFPGDSFPGAWLSWGRALVITWALVSMLGPIAAAVLPLLPLPRPV